MLWDVESPQYTRNHTNLDTIHLLGVVLVEQSLDLNEGIPVADKIRCDLHEYEFVCLRQILFQNRQKSKNLLTCDERKGSMVTLSDADALAPATSGLLHVGSIWGEIQYRRFSWPDETD